ncbi:hypothetical protein RRF57_010624 [Xylaria bambusicola]|uniref:Uncharacterized protein n=1 Tax=Xylaria bambusicola TaxID=326684 RepID=A0AAN7Z9M8_9PEZI
MCSILALSQLIQYSLDAGGALFGLLPKPLDGIIDILEGDVGVGIQVFQLLPNDLDALALNSTSLNKPALLISQLAVLNVSSGHGGWRMVVVRDQHP